MYLMFNSAGYTVNKTHSSLDSHTVNMLVYLRDCCAWHWACNTCNCELMDVPFEELQLNSENGY